MTTNTAVVDAMIHGRRADSTRRRQRVLTALDNAITDGAELSVTDIARRAGVDRTFLYRHRDLLERIHTAGAQPPDKPGLGPSATRASLHADLLAAQQRCARMAAHTQQLEKRLSNYSANKHGPQPYSAPHRHRPASTTHRNARTTSR